jgi:hypothetical protein
MDTTPDVHAASRTGSRAAPKKKRDASVRRRKSPVAPPSRTHDGKPGPFTLTVFTDPGGVAIIKQYEKMGFVLTKNPEKGPGFIELEFTERRDHGQERVSGIRRRAGRGGDDRRDGEG